MRIVLIFLCSFLSVFRSCMTHYVPLKNILKKTYKNFKD